MSDKDDNNITVAEEANIESGKTENSATKETDGSSNANADLINSLSQVLTSSFSKLTEQLTSHLTYDDDDYYEEEEGEYDDTLSETYEPPTKKAKTDQGHAFDLLESMMQNALKPSSQAQAPVKDTAIDSPPDPNALVQGPPNDPTLYGDPEYRKDPPNSHAIKVVDQNQKEVGLAMLHALQQDLENEGTSKAIDSEIAKVIDLLFAAGLPEDKLKEKMNAYERPSNVEKMTSVKVNSVIWDGLNPATRSQDLKMQKVHGILIKAMIAVSQVVSGLKDVLHTDVKEITDGFNKGLDGLVLLVSAAKELNLRRRELIKPAINRDYAHLCSASTVVTDELFGADVSQQVKDITELNRVSQRLQGRRPRGGRRGRFGSRRGQPFLGRGTYGQRRGGRGRGAGRRPHRGPKSGKTE